MNVYRIGPAKYARDLSGEGSRLFGGRWNNKGIACIYTSENRALAILEYSVNVNLDDIPRTLTLITFDISRASVKIIKEAELPGNWRNSPAPSEAKNFGSALLQDPHFSVYKIPSTIVPGEYNYLLNPFHAESKLFTIIDTMDYPYDIRIQQQD